MISMGREKIIGPVRLEVERRLLELDGWHYMEGNPVGWTYNKTVGDITLRLFGCGSVWMFCAMYDPDGTKTKWDISKNSMTLIEAIEAKERFMCSVELKRAVKRVEIDFNL